MPVLSLQSALAADILGLFGYEMQGSVRQGVLRVTALVPELVNASTTAYGGEDPMAVMTVTILAAQAGALNLGNGEVIFTSVDGSSEKDVKRIIVSTVTDPSGATIQITVRSA
jgi:hypothetical protein